MEIEKSSSTDYVKKMRESGLIDEITAEIEAGGGKRKPNGEYRFRCPCPQHEDRHPSADWNPDEGVWTCRSCGEGGGAKGSGKNNFPFSPTLQARGRIV
jgi:hypothetical protein